MDNEEIMTAEDDEIEVPDLPEDLVEEEDEPEESLDSLDEEEPAEEPQEQKGTTEPGYVQRRIDKALARERESIKAEIQAEMEAKYAPIQERLMEMDARDMVRRGEVKNIELARELLRLRQGLPPAEEKAEQPRDESGRFASKSDPVMQTKIDMLAKQADKIRAKTGLDVIEEFQNNPEIKRKVVRGEMDFYDVAEMMKPSAKKRAPSPTRSPNGASGQAANAISSMSDEQFERMERKIKEGARYTLK